MAMRDPRCKMVYIQRHAASVPSYAGVLPQAKREEGAGEKDTKRISS